MTNPVAQGITGSVALPVVYAESYGALSNGVYDDAIAINAAIAAIYTTGGVVQLLNKKYYCQTSINLTHCITLQGFSTGLSPIDYGSGGPMGTQIIGTNGVNCIVANNYGYVRIKDLDVYLATGATTACRGISLISCFYPKVDNVRVTNFSTGIYMHANSDSYINGCYLSSVGSTVNPVVGLEMDTTSHVQNASSYVSNCISAHGSYSGTAYGYWVHGNRPNDTNFDTCEADGVSTGFYIDGTAGIDAGYGGDIRLRGCIADGCFGFGFHVDTLTPDGLCDIDGGWAAGAPTGIYVSGGSTGVTVRGMQVVAGTNGIYFSGSSGEAISNVLAYQSTKGIVADASACVGIIGNKGFQKSATGCCFINLINTSTRCRIIGNSVTPPTPSAGFTYGIVTDAGSDYAEVIGNDISSGGCTNPFILNLGSNTHTVRLDVDGTTIAGGTSITALTGDVTASGSGSVVATLVASGATAGSYTNSNITIDAKGRVISASNGSGGGGGSSGPIFKAYGNTSSVTNATLTKATFGTVEFDSASCYSTTNNRYTPTTAGYYRVSSQVFYPSIGATPARGLVTIYKNGSRYQDGNDLMMSYQAGLIVTGTVYLNGSTDYIEIWTYQATGSTQSLATNSGIDSYFQAEFAHS